MEVESECDGVAVRHGRSREGVLWSREKVRGERK